MNPASDIAVLFVCLGNICRSPTAHGVFREQVQRAGLGERVRIDSAGTGDWHIGHPPDRRTLACAQQRGYDFTDLRARQVEPVDFEHFHYVLAMDQQNLADLRALRRGRGVEPRLFLEYASVAPMLEVPDPYHGGADGFEQVLDLVEDACAGLLRHLREQHRL